MNIPLSYDTTRIKWRNILRSLVFTRIEEFKPDFIFISAGFDGHENEDLTTDISRLSETDFSWITRKIKELANAYCNGRLVSVLEGGYNLSGGIMSPFSQSVNSHVSELRSRSCKKYKSNTEEELKEFMEIDQKEEEERIKKNKERQAEILKLMQRIKNELGSNEYELIDLNSEKIQN